MPQAAHARLRTDKRHPSLSGTKTFSVNPGSQGLRPPGLSFNAEMSERELCRALQFGSR